MRERERAAKKPNWKTERDEKMKSSSSSLIRANSFSLSLSLCVRFCRRAYIFFPFDSVSRAFLSPFISLSL
jgi:hypothetical protein